MKLKRVNLPNYAAIQAEREAQFEQARIKRQTQLCEKTKVRFLLKEKSSLY